jgi:hypothetical protein
MTQNDDEELISDNPYWLKRVWEVLDEHFNPNGFECGGCKRAWDEGLVLGYSRGKKTAKEDELDIQRLRESARKINN